MEVSGCCSSGDDWSEAHHDVRSSMTPRCAGQAPAPLRGGLLELHEVIADHLGDDDQPGSVVAGIETDRGPWVAALAAAGYAVFCDQPGAGGPLPGTALGVGGQVRPRRRAHAGRDRAPGRAHHQPLALDSRAWPSRSGGTDPPAPDPDLDPAPAGQPAALHAARVLPRRPGRVRRQPDRPGHRGGAGGRPITSQGCGTDPVTDRRGAAPGRAQAQRRPRRNPDPDKLRTPQLAWTLGWLTPTRPP